MAWRIPDIVVGFKVGVDRREGFLDEYSVLRDGADDKRDFEEPEVLAQEIQRIGTAVQVTIL